MPEDARIPAIVLGTGITVLGAVRLLGRAGIPTLVPASNPGPVSKSRWYRRPEASGIIEELGLADYLDRLDLARAVLIPCSDDSAMAVAGLGRRVSERFPASTPPLAALERLVDKGRFRDLLVEQGIPGPVTGLVERAEDLDRLPAETMERAFIKPRDSASFFARYGVKGMRAKCPLELQRLVEELSEAGFALMIQEYVPGPPSNHYFLDGFLDRTGQLKGLLARRRLRMYPLDFGNSSAMVTVPIEEVAPARDAILRLLASLSYRGIFSAEFKRDERDGVFRLLEVNARAWWYIEYAGRCGMDAATLAYHDALGGGVPEVTGFEVGRRLVYPYYDIQAGYHQVRRSPSSLVSFVRSWVGADFSVFAADDPAPALSGLARGATRLFRSRILRR